MRHRILRAAHPASRAEAPSIHHRRAARSSREDSERKSSCPGRATKGEAARDQEPQQQKVGRRGQSRNAPSIFSARTVIVEEPADLTAFRRRNYRERLMFLRELLPGKNG